MVNMVKSELFLWPKARSPSHTQRLMSLTNTHKTTGPMMVLCSADFICKELKTISAASTGQAGFKDILSPKIKEKKKENMYLSHLETLGCPEPWNCK